MKKVTFLMMTLIVAIVNLNAQDVIAAWTFDNQIDTAPNTQKLYTANLGIQSGAATLYLDGTNGSSNWTSATQLNRFSGTTLNLPPDGINSSYALALVNSTANGQSIVFKLSMTNLMNLTLSYASRETGTGFNSQEWSYGTNGTDFSTLTTITPGRTTSFVVYNVDFSDIEEINSEPEVYIKLTITGASSVSGNNRLDNIVFKAESSTAPNIRITSPANNATLASSNVTVNFSVSNFDLGTDGKVKYFIGEEDEEFTTENSIEFRDLADGTYTVTLELVDMDEESLDPAVVKTVTFTVNTAGPVVTPIRDIQYTTDPSGDSPKKGQTVWVEGIVTFIQKNATSGSVEGYYIQDTVAPWSGIFVYDLVNTAVIGNTVKMQATVAEYYNSTQLTTVENFEVTDTESSLPAPMEVNCATANTEAYESCYIKLCGFTVTASGSYGNFTVTDASGTFTVNKSYQIKDKYLNINSKYSATGVVNYRDMFRLLPNNLVDGNSCPVVVSTNEMKNTKIYPNPAQDKFHIESQEPLNVSVYNITGQLILEKTLNSGISVIDISNLKSGIYMVKYFGNNSQKSEFRKLIVQ